MSKTDQKKEWKWPLGIFLLYMSFVTATLVFVIFTFTQRTDLVVENYYEKTLTFQDQINRAQNALDLAEPFRYELNGSKIDLYFPPELIPAGIQGEIMFYRPSDSHLDKSYAINIDEYGHQLISLADKETGLWKLQVSWASGDKEYFSESNLFLR